MGWVVNKARRQRLAVAAISGVGGWVKYDWQQAGGSAPPAPAWLRRMLGDEPFQEVVVVGFLDTDGPGGSPASRDAVRHLRAFPRLRALLLNDRQDVGTALDYIPRPADLEVLHFHAD